MMKKRMLIAGGGTGGHLFPGLAIASEFMKRKSEHEVLFVGTTHGIEARAVPEAGYDFEAIPSQGIAGRSYMDRLKAAFIIPWSVFTALGVVGRFKPDLAVGVGGYVSGPVLLAARLRGVPCAIHEQNAAPGLTNRILGRFCRAVFVSFEKAIERFPKAARKGRVFVAGNPVRSEILRALQNQSRSREERQEPPARILIVGGSQGAHGLNLLVADALAELYRNHGHILEIRHQAGERDAAELKKRYEKAGLEASVEPFIKEMGEALLEADLVISRAGAGAVAEIALAGRPSILVPFPYAAGDHQADNARVLADAGAALMFREGETDAYSLSEALSSLLENEDKLTDMAKRAQEAARPDAAAEIVDHCLAIMNEKGKPKA